MTGLKTVLFLVLVPGSVMIVIPIWLIRPGDPVSVDPGFLRWLAPLLWLAGAGILCWCAWEFVHKGHGTPAPTEPPRELVGSGLYRYVRNPMYVGVLLTTAGHPFWFGSSRLAGYAILLWLIFHIFVVFYEEPQLRKTFGATYERYCQRVPRWIPKLR